MTQKTLRRIRKSKRGFTLIELLVVVLIIGILAAIAVPQYFKVVEKGKASEALANLDSIRSAQERYLANTGSYCNTAGFCSGTPGWDLTVPTMKYFTIGTPGLVAGAVPGWSVVVTRNAPGPAVYGAYTVTYTASGGAPIIACSETDCQNDLMPQ
jgi:type IV pilus assembly protein PilE